MWLLARILNLSVQASRSSFTPTTERTEVRIRDTRRKTQNAINTTTDVSRFTLCSETFSLAATIKRILSPHSEHEPTCRFDGLPSHCDLHSRADQDPYGVVLWIQKLVPGFKRKTNREKSKGGGLQPRYHNTLWGSAWDTQLRTESIPHLFDKALGRCSPCCRDCGGKSWH